jgi:hypothetical protein
MSYSKWEPKVSRDNDGAASLSGELPDRDAHPSPGLHGKVLSTGDLPGFDAPTPEYPLCTQIHRYLLLLIEEQQVLPGGCITLPSLASLATFLSVPDTEVRTAFRKLRMQGHDSMIPGCYGNISLWIGIPKSSSHGHRLPSRRSWQVAFIK